MKTSFLQSEAWEEFQRRFGRKTWRVKNILVIRHELMPGLSYLYSPRPDLSGFDAKSLVEFFRDVHDIALNEKSIFFKLEPEEVSAAFFPPKAENRRFVKSQKNIQPVKTLVLDLTESEDELLARMHPKTRYNIRLAQKRGTIIANLGRLEEEQFEKVFELLKDTARRQGFSLHPKDYYRKMIDVLGQHGLLQVYLALFKGEIVAANFTVFYGDRAVYLHGASDYRHKNLMAAHELHWRVIKEAKGQGFKEYDFWGISEKYAGVSRFKRSFGGREIEYPGSFDLVFNPLWYNMYKIGSKLSRLAGRN